MEKTLIRAANRHLRKTDSIMARLMKCCDPITFNSTRPPHYHALVRAIINQQLSVKAAATIQKRLQTKHGGRYFKAERILKLKLTTLRKCGLSSNKVRYVRTLAQAITSGVLNFRKLANQDDDGVRATLTQYPGIGQWSADMFLITALRRPDVFPIGDLVLRKSMQRHYRLPDDTQHDKYISIANTWRPYRSFASFYLWKTSP